MKYWLKSIFYYAGSIYFAIILIGLTVLFVITGTVLESYADSHQYAALWTYQNPLFAFLLWGFFINILISALRRWPFQGKHVPFLITHLGLLMILSGVLIKNYFGVQGSMVVLEGSGSQHLLIAEQPALWIESKTKASTIPLPKNLTSSFGDHDLQIRVARYAPHALERLSSWIQGPHAYILGLRPFAVHEWTEGELPLSGKVRFEGPESEPWKIHALRVKEAKSLLEGQPIGARELWIVEDKFGNTHLCCQDKQGKQIVQTINPQKLARYMVYDKGFGGYTVPVDLPIGEKGVTLEAPLAREFREMRPPLKSEVHRPLVTLEMREGELKEFVTLGYDRYGTGWKWPCLGGRYLLRFQPFLQDIPYRVRLHSARQINYANSNQPFSYECEIAITDQRDGKTVKTALRMNRVHETWDGYRFYMASISPSDNSAVHRVQIVVNHDPAKYWLTYPGAGMLTLGIVLLFWRKRR